jgi:uncharacterized membrane protein YphA (DoxX/SURF4 family)
MRHLFYCATVGRVGSVGLLLLRLVMGTAFLFHGWPVPDLNRGPAPTLYNTKSFNYVR